MVQKRRRKLNERLLRPHLPRHLPRPLEKQPATTRLLAVAGARRSKP
jgi:hypothetical protein